MKLTLILLFPFIFLPPCADAWENFLLAISPRPNINYATCHLSDLLCSTASIPTQKELSDQVGSPLNSSSFCCGEQGFFMYGTCTGEKNYSNVPICQEPSLAGRWEKKRPECGEGCRLRSKEGVTVEELAVVMRRENSNFCLTNFCDYGSYDWILTMDICECETEYEAKKKMGEHGAKDNLQCVGSEVGGIVYEPVCNGSEMCVRSCCAEHESWDGGNCSSSSDLFHVHDLFPTNSSTDGFSIEFSSWTMECPDGTDWIQLFPDWSCYDRGVLSDYGQMLFKDRGVQLQYGEFCIAKLNQTSRKGNAFIQACMPSKKNKNPPPFYSYVLGTSILCMFLTIILYVTSPELTNQTNKIMINFTVSLLFAYLALIFIQRPEIFQENVGLSRILCRSLGHVEQFSFLSAFSWISIMTFENLNQLMGLSQVKSLEKTTNSMKTQVCIGYGLPFALSLATGFVEMFAPECAIYKPRFGQRTCFFYGNFGQFLWYYLPISVMLLINTSIFLYIIVNINRVLKSAEPTSGLSSRQTKKKVEEGLLYTRLFVGMGLNWYLEILGWTLGSYVEESWWQVVPDCINMLQGVWVFLNFVSQRKVVRVIKKRQRSIFRTRETKSI